MVNKTLVKLRNEAGIDYYDVSQVKSAIRIATEKIHYSNSSIIEMKNDANSFANRVTEFLYENCYINDSQKYFLGKLGIDFRIRLLSKIVRDNYEYQVFYDSEDLLTDELFALNEKSELVFKDVVLRKELLKSKIQTKKELKALQKQKSYLTKGA